MGLARRCSLRSIIVQQLTRAPVQGSARLAPLVLQQQEPQALVRLHQGTVPTRLKHKVTNIHSVEPVEPFFLSFSFDLSRRRDVGDRQYVKSDGSITENPQEAVAFTITTDGQLMSGRGYVSTSGQVPSQRFQVQSSLEPISTRFSVEAKGTLSWENSLFVNGRAVFCVIEALFVAFDGNLPAGCRRIRLDSIPSREVQSSSSMITVSTVSATQSPKTTTKTTPTYVSSTTTQTTAVSTPTTSYAPGTVFGSLAYGSPRGCFVSSINSPAVLGPYTTVSNLNQCADFCVGFNYFGVQAGKSQKNKISSHTANRTTKVQFAPAETVS